MHRDELKLHKIGRVKLLSGIADQHQVTSPPGPPVKPVRTSIDTEVVIILGAVLCVLICAVWVHSLIRCIIRRNRSLAVTGTGATGVGGAGSNDDISSTVGLDPKMIAALPVIPVRPPGDDPVTDRVDNIKETLSCNKECIVCLQEFMAGERMKLLPNCGHGFHVDCIGAWLMGHSSCPICRHGVLEPPSPASGNSFSATSGGSAAFLLSSPIMRQFQLELSMRSLEDVQLRNQRLQFQQDQIQQQITELQQLRQNGPSSSSSPTDRGVLRFFSRSNTDSNLAP